MEYLPIIGVVLLFWLFFIRPQSRRQKELRAMQAALSVGDQVMLTSGIFATVRALEEDHVMVEIADGVAMKVARGAIGNKVPDETTPDENHTEGDDRVDTPDAEES